MLYITQAGRAAAWAERAKRGEFVSDPFETLDLELPQRVYSITSALLIATAFGKSTPTFLTDIVGVQSNVSQMLEALQAPAVGLILASVGSAAVCLLQAREKNRSAPIWALKGVLGGPLTVRQLRGLQDLITRGEQDDANKARSSS